MCEEQRFGEVSIYQPVCSPPGRGTVESCSAYLFLRSVEGFAEKKKEERTSRGSKGVTSLSGEIA